MNKLLVFLTLLLILISSGCVAISYNKIRIGYIDDEVLISEDGSKVRRENTVGWIFQWWRD